MLVSDQTKAVQDWMCMCAYAEPSNSTMCTDGAIRLVGGITEREGRVEICLQNQWGTVCDNGWGGSDSRVVCRQLGFDAIGLLFNIVLNPY